MNDTLINEPAGARQIYALEDTGFKEVPKKFRRFYRIWRGRCDTLAANEVLCPVCKIVIRSLQDLRPGDKVYCMPCMSRLIVEQEDGMLVARVTY